MRVPQFDSMTYRATRELDDQVIHFYQCETKVTVCPTCSGERITKGGSRSSLLRHDTHRSPGGDKPVYLEIRRRFFNCVECGLKPGAPIPVPRATVKSTCHFWEQVAQCDLPIYDAAEYFVISHSTVKELRKCSGVYVPRSKRAENLAGRKERREENIKPPMSDGIYSAIYAIVQECGGIKVKELLGMLKSVGLVGGQKAITGLTGDHIGTVSNGVLRLNDFILPSHLQWPATGPAPKTMLGKHRAEQPAIRRELMGYSMEVAA